MTQPIDPRRLRPRRRWYGIAVLVVVLSLAVGAVGMASGYYWTEHTYPDFQTYPGMKATSVELDSDSEYALYVPKNASPSCSLNGQTFRSSTEALEFTRDGQRWAHVRNLTVATSGTYSVSCLAPTYGFGEPPPYDKYRLLAGSGLATLVGLPCLGIPIGLAIALVTWLRRSDHKRWTQTAPRPDVPLSAPPAGSQAQEAPSHP